MKYKIGDAFVGKMKSSPHLFTSTITDIDILEQKYQISFVYTKGCDRDDFVCWYPEESVILMITDDRLGKPKHTSHLDDELFEL